MLNRMKANLKTIFILVLLIFIVSCSKPQPQVCFNHICVDVKIANTPSEQSQGLMYEKSLDGGMLFKFDKMGRYYFWMENTLIPLDMVWLDNNQKIVHIEKSVPPCKVEECPSYGPQADSMYVLEVNAGFMDANGLSYESN